MKSATDGCTVKVHYTGKLTDGSEFDSSANREPLEFTIGKKQMIRGFEVGVIDMKVGEKKKIEIEPADAYGEHRKELQVTVEKKHFPDEFTPEIGLRFQVKQPDETYVDMTVAKIDGDNVVLDANHPLAGQKLIFEIEMVEIS